jgi:hypothetical protein
MGRPATALTSAGEPHHLPFMRQPLNSGWAQQSSAAVSSLMLSRGRSDETMTPSEFRVEKSDRGYRVTLYRNGEYYVTFVDGLTKAAATQEALSLAAFWRRIRSGPGPGEALVCKRAS